MKRFAVLFVVGLVALCMNLSIRQVAARPEYKARLDEATKGGKAAEAIKEAKCNNCHYGTSKKNRNDFGQALNKHMNADTFKELRENKEELNKKIDAALKAALKEKSKQGKTFGEIIESGSLPAVNPTE
jgi:hypothetical protein